MEHRLKVFLILLEVFDMFQLSSRELEAHNRKKLTQQLNIHKAITIII